jgi:hypothetical protein
MSGATLQIGPPHAGRTLDTDRRFRPMGGVSLPEAVAAAMDDPRQRRDGDRRLLLPSRSSGLGLRDAIERWRQSVEDWQVELAEARAVGEDVHLDDPAVSNREAADRERLPVPECDDAGGAVDERRPHLEVGARECDRLAGDGGRAVVDPRGPDGKGPCVRPLDNVGTSRFAFRELSMFSATRATTVVSHPSRFSTPLASRRLSRSHASCSASSASLSDPSIR